MHPFVLKDIFHDEVGGKILLAKLPDILVLE
jgi:hypothetical protein